jgi:hypothetical protein
MSSRVMFKIGDAISIAHDQIFYLSVVTNFTLISPNMFVRICTACVVCCLSTEQRVSSPLRSWNRKSAFPLTVCHTIIGVLAELQIQKALIKARMRL